MHFYQAEVLVPSPLPPHLIVFLEDQKATKCTGPATRKISTSHRAESKTEGGELPKLELPRVERAELRESKSCTAARPTTVTSSSHTLDDGKASLVLQDDVLSASGDEGRRLFAKFNAWWVSMLLYRCLAAVSLALVFAVELRHYFASLPFLDRLRLRHLTDWSQALKLPPSQPPVKRNDLCDFACNLSVGVTPCCGIRRCSVHTKYSWCCELSMSTVNDSRPKVAVE